MSLSNVILFVVTIVSAMASVEAYAELDPRLADLIQNRALQVACGDPRFVEIGELSRDECREVSSHAIGECWALMDPLIPNVKLGDGSVLEEGTSRSIVGLTLLLAKCVQANVLFGLTSHQKSSLSMDGESLLQSRDDSISKGTECSGEDAARMWAASVDSITTEFMRSRSQLLSLREKFVKSGYRSVLASRMSGSITALTRESEVVHLDAEESTAWVEHLDSARIGAIASIDGAVSLGHRDLHQNRCYVYLVYYVDNDATSHGSCPRELTRTDCGSCTVGNDDALNTNVLWMTRSHFENLNADSTDDRAVRESLYRCTID